MRSPKYLSTLSLALISALYGASAAWATPMAASNVGGSIGFMGNIPALRDIAMVGESKFCANAMPHIDPAIQYQIRLLGICADITPERNTSSPDLDLDVSAASSNTLLISSSLSSSNRIPAISVSTEAVLVPRAIPEPGTWALIGLGLAGVSLTRRRQI